MKFLRKLLSNYNSKYTSFTPACFTHRYRYHLSTFASSKTLLDCLSHHFYIYFNEMLFQICHMSTRNKWCQQVMSNFIFNGTFIIIITIQNLFVIQIVCYPSISLTIKDWLSYSGNNISLLTLMVENKMHTKNSPHCVISQPL